MRVTSLGPASVFNCCFDVSSARHICVALAKIEVSFTHQSCPKCGVADADDNSIANQAFSQLAVFAGCSHILELRQVLIYCLTRLLTSCIEYVPLVRNVFLRGAVRVEFLHQWSYFVGFTISKSERVEDINSFTPDDMKEDRTLYRFILCRGTGREFV